MVRDSDKLSETGVKKMLAINTKLSCFASPYMISNRSTIYDCTNVEMHICRSVIIV